MEDTLSQIRIPFAQELNGSRKDLLTAVSDALKKSLTDRNISVDISTNPILVGLWKKKQIGKIIDIKVSIQTYDE